MTGPKRPAETYFNRGLWGWLASTWVKLSVLWGYTDTAEEGMTSTTGAAGLRTLQSTVVPAGYVYVIEGACARNVNNICTTILVLAHIGTVDMMLIDIGSPAAAKWQMWSGRVTLGPGDSMYAYFYGCLLDDDVQFRVSGYKMPIA